MRTDRTLLPPNRQLGAVPGARPRFEHHDNYRRPESYVLSPVRRITIPGVESSVLLTTDWGEYRFLSDTECCDLEAGRLPPGVPLYDDLLAKHMLIEGKGSTERRLIAAKLRTKKAFLRYGPSLHIFVVTLRCDHSCLYCQVSRQSADRSQFDMTAETAAAAVDRLFESSSPVLTVEFQGGEPLLAYPRIREIVERIETRNSEARRNIVYTISSTLHHISDEVLRFFSEHDFRVSTSLDGPAALHNANRILPSRDAYARTLAGLERVRQHLGQDRVAALTTLTRSSLAEPEAIVDEYLRLGFRSIFLRPLSPYGFALRSRGKTGYGMAEFLQFYDRALAYILELNRRGVEIEEAYAAILLSHILTPFPSGYIDLRSPAGAGLGVLVYNYDGGVYASDEARMLAETGDRSFRLGSVNEPLASLMASPAMDLLRRANMAERLDGCRDCAFLPYCGADPVQSHATEPNRYGRKPSDAHCERHMGLFNILFQYLAEADPQIMRIFLAWAMRTSPQALHHGPDG